MQEKKPSNQEDLHRPRIGIDLLGCETPGDVFLKALIAHRFEENHPPKFTVFGTEEIFKSVAVPEDIHCHTVTETIEMDEDPLTAVRRKKDSSISVGIGQVKTYDLDAFISAGNTGALLASAKIQLPMLPGIDRPALLTLIPTKKDLVAVIDVGASVDVKAENLLQYAKMGIAYQKSRGISHPTVGLLNIGTEEQKGTQEIRRAHKLLQKLNQEAPIDNPIFAGNIEGRDVFHGEIDILVTDGFTGNVFLKTSEGIASFVLDQMQNLGIFESLPGIQSIVRQLRERLHYAEHPGALFTGVDGIVMKCHGASPPEAILSTIKGASRLVQHSFLEKIKSEL